MIAVDTNIMVYAFRRDSKFHSAASRCVRRLYEGDDHWAIAWPTIYEFINVVTHPKIYAPASPINDALRAIESWMAAGNLLLLHESADFYPTLHRLLWDGNVQGPKVHDARIAALCLHHGVSEIWTADRDFSAFPKLKARNPLKES
jgi:uncharacterized protein